MMLWLCKVEMADNQANSGAACEQFHETTATASFAFEHHIHTPMLGFQLNAGLTHCTNITLERLLQIPEKQTKYKSNWILSV